MAVVTTVVFVDCEGDEFPIAVAPGEREIERARARIEEIIAAGVFRPTDGRVEYLRSEGGE